MRLLKLILFLIGLIGLYVNTSLGLPAKIAETIPKTMNIISIVRDDQAVWAMGAYGNPEIVIPNMDRLARGGALFTNCFVATGVCTPIRISFLTGLFSPQVGVTDVGTVGDIQQVRSGVPTWPKALKKHGYATGLIGKWHLGREMHCYPVHFGLDYYFVIQRGLRP